MGFRVHNKEIIRYESLHRVNSAACQDHDYRMNEGIYGGVASMEAYVGDECQSLHNRGEGIPGGSGKKHGGGRSHWPWSGGILRSEPLVLGIKFSTVTALLFPPARTLPLY